MSWTSKPVDMSKFLDMATSLHPPQPCEQRLPGNGVIAWGVVPCKGVSLNRSTYYTAIGQRAVGFLLTWNVNGPYSPQAHILKRRNNSFDVYLDGSLRWRGVGRRRAFREVALMIPLLGSAE